MLVLLLGLVASAYVGRLGQLHNPRMAERAEASHIWTPLLTLLDHMRQHGFIREGLDLSYLVETEAADVVGALRDAAGAVEPAPVAEALVAERF